MSGDREWAVRVVDTAPGMEERVVPVGDRHWGNVRVARIEQQNAVRSSPWPIAAEVVWRYRFMPDMPWEAV